MYKRLLVLFLSIGTIVAFGYALGGMGGYLYGKGRPLVAAGGLFGGCLSSYAALKLWKVYLEDIAAEDREIARKKAEEQ